MLLLKLIVAHLVDKYPPVSGTVGFVTVLRLQLAECDAV